LGELNAVKVGGSFRIPRADLERYLEEHMTTAVPS
jgi:excisionase family DNA binding protein